MKARFVLILTTVILVTAMLMTACSTPAQQNTGTGPTTTVTSTVTATAPSGTAGKTYNFKMAIANDRGTKLFAWTQQMCDTIKAASGGRLNIEVFGAEEIIPVMQQWDGVVAGSIDMELSYGYWFSKTKMNALAGLQFPYVIDPSDAFAIEYGLGIEQKIADAYKPLGLQLVGVITPEADGHILSKVPITSIDSFKGLKIRASGITASTLKAIGASVVTVSGPEVYGALEKSVVDAVYLGPISYQYQMHLGDVTKYILMPAINRGTGGQITMNLKTWQSLPADLQQILYQGTKFYVSYAMAQRGDDIDDTQSLINKGLKVTSIPMADRSKIANAAIGVYDEWYNDAATEKAFKDVWPTIKAYLQKVIAANG